MTTTTEQIDIQAMQTRERIALATAAAMFVAGVILMTVILPAEYGVDPMGTGRLLGLTQIAQAESAPAAEATGAVSSLEPVRPDANTAQNASYKQDTRTLKLGPFEAMEFKYRMEKGASLVYAWNATGKVKAEFHGEPQGAPKNYAEFYQKIDATGANGSFFAPSTGIHGWYFENLGADPVTVTLKTSGFYTGGIQFSRAGREEVSIPD